MIESRRTAPRRPGLALIALLGATLALAGPWTGAHAAVNPDDLLPVDEAYVLSARADGADRIRIDWKIAEGYYLYRHRTSVEASPAFGQGALQLPPGKAYTDEFFGDVETYRQHLTAILPGRAGVGTVTLKVKYQGCADLGICYPPQTRELSVTLPPAADASMPAPTPNPGGLRLPGSAAGSSNVAPAGNPLLPATTASGLPRPLPAEQAFGVTATVQDARHVRVQFDVAPGYYLYRDKTAFAIEAEGMQTGRAEWPEARPYHDEHFGTVSVFFDPVAARVPLRRDTGAATAATLTVEFQGCQDGGICYPLMTRQLGLSLPAAEPLPASSATPLPAKAGDDATAAPSPDESTDPEAPPADARNPDVDADAGVDATGDAVSRTPTPRPVASPLPAGASADSVPARHTRLNLATALLLALGGGLILNLMPCVLPVLSLKALSLASTAGSPGATRRSALWYTTGVVISFAALGALALALREAGLALGWGFQLQQPLVVAALGLLMFGLGLSLSGVWHVGGAWTGMGHGLTTRQGPMGDFFTGVLAVVVATPCTAPFMGAALAWAFTAETLTALLVFVALGLGLALPFLLIGFVPALARRLPRPGAWMETLKQLLAFPLYLTAAWLVWVLAKQRGADAVGLWLVAATLAAFAAWAWSRHRSGGRAWGLVAAGLALFALAWPLARIHALPRPDRTPGMDTGTHQALAAVAYSEQRLADLRAAGRPVFVNMTADWCVTCKANEKAVFAGDGFRDALDAADAVYMVGDWTDVDPGITAFLQRYEAVGVPLYVVFPANGGEGRVLPTVLTPDIAREALEDAAR